MGITALWNSISAIFTIILIVVIAGLGFYAYNLGSAKALLVAQKAAIAITLTESQANLKQLRNDINFQNDQIEKFKADAVLREASYAADIAKAKTTADKYKKQAEELLNRPKPQNTTNCDAANALILEELKNATK